MPNEHISNHHHDRQALMIMGVMNKRDLIPIHGQATL